jgi:hypothetical protein
MWPVVALAVLLFGGLGAAAVVARKPAALKGLAEVAGSKLTRAPILKATPGAVAGAAAKAKAKASALAALQVRIGRQAYILANRPPPGGWPDQQTAWLNANSLSPDVVYPEWGWVTPAQANGFGGGARVVAYFDIDANHHVNWWVNPDGTWGYDDKSPSSFSRTLQSLASDLAVAAGVLGFVGAGQFVYLLNALGGNGSPAVLAQSLQNDWVNLQADEGMAEAVQSGDWAKAYDKATGGQGASNLAAQFAPLSPPGRDGSAPS